MPVKWTFELEQILLLKILETHDITVDYKKVADVWPTDHGDVPTPRAIQEHLHKLRATAKGKTTSAANTSTKGTPTKSTPAKSTPSKTTPRKPRNPKTPDTAVKSVAGNSDVTMSGMSGGSSGGKGGGRKRKTAPKLEAASNNLNKDEEDEQKTPRIPKSELKALGVSSTEHAGYYDVTQTSDTEIEEAEAADGSPSKRTKLYGPSIAGRTVPGSLFNGSAHGPGLAATGKSGETDVPAVHRSSSAKKLKDLHDFKNLKNTGESTNDMTGDNDDGARLEDDDDDIGSGTEEMDAKMNLDRPYDMDGGLEDEISEAV